MSRFLLLAALFFAFGCGADDEDQQAETPAETSKTAEDDGDPQVTKLMKLATEQARQGAVGKAIESLSQAIGFDPDNADAYRMRAEVYTAIREDANALADLGAAIRIDPKNAKLRASRGFFLMSRGQGDRAIKDFDEAVTLDPTLKTAFNNRGLIKVAKNAFDDAIADFDKAIELDAEYADAFNNRGYARFRAGKNKEAIADFDTALKINPEYVNPYNNRGLVNFQDENFTAAAADFSEAIKRNPYDVKYFEHRRQSYLKLEDAAKAKLDSERISWLQQLATLTRKAVSAPNELAPFVARGDFLARAQEWDRAITDYSRLIALAPTNPNGYARRAAAWLQKGDFDKAIADCTKVIDDESIETTTEAHSIRGDAFVGIKRFADAVADYEKAKRFDTKAAQAYHMYALTLKEKGEDSAATRYFQQALAMDPNLNRSRN
ncbi:MAG: tetratricopeptide repeat protein [Planctomycetota bacterium]|nr:tetratricopeptide repeat protein [Planctomycetota bacterium]